MRPTCVDGAGVGDAPGLALALRPVPPRVRCDVLSEPKAGSTRAQYEDAWFVPRPRDAAAGARGAAVPQSIAVSRSIAAEGCTIAVADGASESMLAGAWARQLVRAVGGSGGRDLDAAALAERICAAAGRWPAYVNRYVRRRERLGRPIAWYEESKLEQGAHATLLGISFRCDPGGGPTDEPASESAGKPENELACAGTWSAAALGDACGFRVRDARLAEAFPVESPEDFGSSPDLAGTRAPDRALLERRTVARRGTWLPGDVFYLATDAAAQWFLVEARAHRQPWRQADEAFKDPAGWLAELRADRRIRNDDVTIVRCRLEQDAAP